MSVLVCLGVGRGVAFLEVMKEGEMMWKGKLHDVNALVKSQRMYGMSCT